MYFNFNKMLFPFVQDQNLMRNYNLYGYLCSLLCKIFKQYENMMRSFIIFHLLDKDHVEI